MSESISKILLVEDDQNFGIILRDYLIINNYDVVHAKNGMEGFEKFKKMALLSRKKLKIKIRILLLYF